MKERGLDRGDAALFRLMSKRVGACLRHWEKDRAAIQSILGLLLSGYGIRLKEHPCTHFIGFITIGNYVTHNCPRFGKWELAVP